MHLTTERLHLRSVEHSDIEPLYALLDDWAVVRWLAAPPWPIGLSDIDDFISGLLADRSPGREIYLVIEGQGTVLGAISWRVRQPSQVQSAAGPNIGYWLGAAHWGKGYMTEAAAAVVAHIFATSSADAIYSGAFAGNVASLHVQTKLGFVRDGETTFRCNPQDADLAHVNTRLPRH